MTTENNNLIKVAIIDDHRMVSDGLEMIINNSGFAEVIDKAYSIKGCFTLLENQQPDVLLLDLNMKDGNSLDYIDKIVKTYPSLKVMLITQLSETAVIKRALSQGALGYILKSSTADVIIEGIKTVAENNRYLCPMAQEQLMKKDKKYEKLTPRERDILKLIVDGKTMKEIADELNLGFETVRSYCKYIRLKLNANNIASLVKTAIEQGLV